MSVRLLVPLLVVTVGCAEQPGQFAAVRAKLPAPAVPAPADRKAADVPRRIIYTAGVDLAVEDLDPVTAKARELVAGYGGYVSKAETTGRSESRRTATLTVRVCRPTSSRRPSRRSPGWASSPAPPPTRRT